MTITSITVVIIVVTTGKIGLEMLRLVGLAQGCGQKKHGQRVLICESIASTHVSGHKTKDLPLDVLELLAS